MWLLYQFVFWVLTGLTFYFSVWLGICFLAGYALYICLKSEPPKNAASVMPPDSTHSNEYETPAEAYARYEVGWRYGFACAADAGELDLDHLMLGFDGYAQQQRYGAKRIEARRVFEKLFPDKAWQFKPYMAFALEIKEKPTYIRNMEALLHMIDRKGHEYLAHQQRLKVTEAFPNWMFSSVCDSRSPAGCNDLDGQIYPHNHPCWTTTGPLVCSRAWCRCTVTVALRP